MLQKPIEKVRKEYAKQWMVIPGVEGVAIGRSDDKFCIKVFSSIKKDKLRAKIPSTIEGYPVKIERTGTFHSLNEE